jgi:hypothetical protein
MPRTSKGHKRAADAIGNAVHVMRIATGEIEESGQTEDGRSKAAVELGRQSRQAAGAEKNRDRKEGRQHETRQQVVAVLTPALNTRTSQVGCTKKRAGAA